MNSANDAVAEEKEKAGDSQEIPIESHQQALPAMNLAQNGSKTLQVTSCSPNPARKYAEATMNMPLFDPPRWGWTVIGGVADVLPPHERARRKSSSAAFRREYQQRKRRLHSISSISATEQTHKSVSAQMPGSCDATVSKQQSTPGEGIFKNKLDSAQTVMTQVAVTATAATTTGDSNPSERLPQPKDPHSYAIDNQVAQSDAPSVSYPLQNDIRIVSSRSAPSPIIPQGVAFASFDKSSTNGAPPNGTVQHQSTNNVQTHPIGNTQATPQALMQLPGAFSGTSPEMVDLGTQLVGISSHFLGLSIKKIPNNDAFARKNNAVDGVDTITARPTSQNMKNGPKPVTVVSNYECSVRAVGESDSDVVVRGGHDKTAILDMYAYHRGREGMEARDKNSGELFCKQNATDTNHDLDAPKSIFTVKVQFPLDQEDGDAAGSNKTMYTDTLEWNLSDPSNPSPMDFATSIATEFGLSMGATLDLAASIDQQVENHLAGQYQYSEPIAVKDPQGLSDRDRQSRPIVQAYRYDQVTEAGKGGLFRPKRARQTVRARSLATVSGRVNSITTTNASDTESITAEIGPFPFSDRRRSSMESVSSAKDTEGLGEDEEVGQEFVDETKKRSQNASILETTQNCQNGIVGQLEEFKNGHCHICHKRADICFQFACGKKNHVYCLYHVNTRLGITENFACPSCPICSLSCECAKCSRKLKAVAKIFKAKCLEQNKPPADVDFPDILDVCTTKQLREFTKAADSIIRKRKLDDLDNQRLPNATNQRLPNATVSNDKKAKRTYQLPHEMMVPKPPLTDFPTEKYLGKDLEVATAKDYFTVFSAEGYRLVDEVPNVWLEEADTSETERPSTSEDQIPFKEAEVIDDGSVDYCHFCMKPGDIICCDFCPRAFHEKCMIENGYHDQTISDEDAKWECVICKNEKGVLNDDFIDGKSSMDQVFSSFITADISDEKVLRGIEVLSIIHEMVLKLMKYDFGYMFSEPVDLDTVPGYTIVVRRPMDLGTISRNLINGEYSKLMSEGYSMDEVLTRVLKDVELVWHNCLLYNFEGSAVCRMAHVLRRRSSMIRNRSFNYKLGASVKQKLEDFVHDTENARAAMIKSSVPGVASSESYEEARWKTIMHSKPRSKHCIDINIWSPKNSKSIALLDPVSGRLVKTYGTKRGASKAVNQLLELGHRCEWNAKSGLNMRLVAEKSGSDPTMLLFGYRWVFLDDLRSKKVVFRKMEHGVIEMRQSRGTFVFQSVEEALSCPDIPKETDNASLRSFLKLLKPSREWEVNGELLWRRTEPQRTETREYTDGDEKRDKTEVIPRSNEESSSKTVEWKRCAVIKRDVVTGRNLMGFDTRSTAYTDWTHSAIASPFFLEMEDRSMEHFQRFYLDGDRNVDGIVWWSNPDFFEMQGVSGQELGPPGPS